MEDYIQHHGILGQKWGKRNGPPYPLNASDHSASEKKAGWRNSLSGGGFTLSPKQKAFIKAGAAIAATALIAYGAYKLSDAGVLNNAKTGKKLVDNIVKPIKPWDEAEASKLDGVIYFKEIDLMNARIRHRKALQTLERIIYDDVPPEYQKSYLDLNTNHDDFMGAHRIEYGINRKLENTLHQGTTMGNLIVFANDFSGGKVSLSAERDPLFRMISKIANGANDIASYIDNEGAINGIQPQDAQNVLSMLRAVDEIINVN